MSKIKEYETREEMYLDIPKGGVGAEIGSCKGLNAISMFHIAKPSHMFLVDIWTEKDPEGNDWCRGTDPTLWYANHENLVRSFFEEQIQQGAITTVRELGANFLYTLEDNSLDWIYIDANHEYDAVSMEIDMAIPKVKKGGYIMGHDYTVETLLWGNSVVRAVNERIQTGDMKMVGISIESFPSFICQILTT